MTIPCPTTDEDQLYEDFREAGFCVVANALNEEQVAGMRSRLVEQAEAERQQGLDFRDGGSDQNWGAFRNADGRIRPEAFTEEAGGRNQRVWMLVHKGKVFLDIFKVKSVRGIVDRFLGEEYLLSSYGANIAKPGGVEMPLHTDQWWMPSPTRSGRKPLPIGSIRRDRFDEDSELIDPPMIAPLAAVNVIWMLVDFIAEIGATRSREPSERPAAGCGRGAERRPARSPRRFSDRTRCEDVARNRCEHGQAGSPGPSFYLLWAAV